MKDESNNSALQELADAVVEMAKKIKNNENEKSQLKRNIDQLKTKAKTEIYKELLEKQ